MKRVVARNSGRDRLPQLSLLAEDTPEFKQVMPAAIKKPVSGKKPRTISNGEPFTPETASRCLNAAVRFLRDRPRSEYEVRARLKHHRYDSQCIEATIATIKGKDLIDDMAFARFWVDNRDAFRPRSQRLIKAELRQKGVALDIIDQMVFASDETEGAFQVARQKARSLPRTDYHGFHRRLGDYLKRRGYDYAVIKKAVEQVWNEQTDTASSPGQK